MKSTFLVTIEHDRPIDGLMDTVGGRLWGIDHVVPHGVAVAPGPDGMEAVEHMARQEDGSQVMQSFIIHVGGLPTVKVEDVPLTVAAEQILPKSVNLDPLPEVVNKDSLTREQMDHMAMRLTEGLTFDNIEA